MWHALQQNLFAPAARRVGTIAGTAFATYGATTDVVNAVTLVVTWVLFAGIDLAVSFASRRGSN